MSTPRALLIGIGAYPNFPEDRLAGPVSDARLMARLLIERFGFAPENTRLLLEEAATRAGILGALDELLQQTEPGDPVVLYYSGHGSQRLELAPEGEEADGFEEVLVTWDSAHRGEGENRDISDDELAVWLARAGERTDNLTLIFDCCHSATLDRRSGARNVRQDRRRRFGPRPTRAPRGGSGWLPLSSTYTLLAACRDDEVSRELNTPEGPHGALTWRLAEALVAPEAVRQSWQQIFERVAARVSAEHIAQHPQIQGALDRVPFGLQRAPLPGVGVGERLGDELPLEAGTLHGVRPGSVWRLVEPSGGPTLAEVEVFEVGPLSARARLRGRLDGPSEALRAVPGPGALGGEPLELVLDDSVPVETEAALGPLLAEAGLVEIGETGSLRLLWIPARTVVQDGELGAELGPSPHPRYAVRRLDEHILPPLDASADGALQRLAAKLDALARAERLAGLRNPDPWSELQDRVHLNVLRYEADDRLAPAAPDPTSGRLVLREGEPFSLELHNDAPRPVFVAVADIGLLCSIQIFYRGGPIAPGGRVVVDRRRRLRAGFPRGWEALRDRQGAPRQEGTERLVLLASTSPAALSGLEQAGVQTRDLLGPERLDEDWGVALRSLVLRRGGG